MKTLILTVDPEVFKHGDFIRDRLKRCTDSLEKHDVDYDLFYGPTSVEKNNEYVEKHNMPYFLWSTYSQVLAQHYADWHERSGDVGCIMSFTEAFQRCIDDNEPYLILEYDAYLVKPIDFDIVDGWYYRLHEIPHGHGQVVTPKAAKVLINSKRFPQHRDWFKGYDTHIKNHHQNILVVKPGYVDGNETACKEECTRYTRTHK